MKNKIIYPALLSFVFVFAGYAWGVSKQHLALISIIMAVNLVVIRAKTDFALIERLVAWFGLSHRKAHNIFNFVSPDYVPTSARSPILS